MACPSNSVSSGNADTQCTCETNLVTSANSSTTTSEACDSCAMNTYFNGLLCDNCPGNSTRHFQKDESHCVCLNNTVTTDGDATTTFLPCIGKQEQLCYEPTHILKEFSNNAASIISIHVYWMHEYLTFSRNIIFLWYQ